MTEKQTLKLMKKYDRQFTNAIGNFIETSMQVDDFDDFNIRGHMIGKALCNHLVGHLSALFRGDMQEVQDFIVKGINIDLNAIRNFNRKNK